MPEYKGEDQPFHSYTFEYNNMVDGCITDFARATVDNDGTVRVVSVQDSNTGELDFKRNSEMEDTVLQMNLRSIYTTSTTEYIGYTRSFDPEIVLYEDDLYIQYWVTANYKDIPKDRQCSAYVMRVLVPLYLVTEKSTE